MELIFEILTNMRHENIRSGRDVRKTSFSSFRFLGSGRNKLSLSHTLSLSLSLRSLMDNYKFLYMNIAIA